MLLRRSTSLVAQSRKLNNIHSRLVGVSNGVNLTPTASTLCFSTSSALKDEKKPAPMSHLGVDNMKIVLLTCLKDHQLDK